MEIMISSIGDLSVSTIYGGTYNAKYTKLHDRFTIEFNGKVPSRRTIRVLFKEINSQIHHCNCNKNINCGSAIKDE